MEEDITDRLSMAELLFADPSLHAMAYDMRAAGIATLGDLSKLTEDELLKYAQSSRKVEKVKKLLSAYDRSLRVGS